MKMDELHFKAVSFIFFFPQFLNLLVIGLNRVGTKVNINATEGCSSLQVILNTFLDKTHSFIFYMNCRIKKSSVKNNFILVKKSPSPV